MAGREDIRGLERRLAQAESRAAELQAANEALRESETQYRSLFETMEEGFVINQLIRDENGKAIDSRYLALNPVVEKLVGWNPKTTVGKLMSEILPPEETAYWVNDFAAIVASGKSSQTEHEHKSLGMWFRANTTPIGGDRLALVYQNITSQKRAEITLRESEERQAFLLQLADTLRPLDAAAEIQGEATRLLREHLAAGWCYYVEWDEAAKRGVVLRDATRDGLPSLVGSHDVSDVPAFLDMLRTGNVLNVRDYANFDGLGPELRARYTALGFRSMLIATLVKEGRLVASLLLGDTEVRAWSGVSSVFSARRTAISPAHRVPSESLRGPGRCCEGLLDRSRGEGAPLMVNVQAPIW